MKTAKKEKKPHESGRVNNSELLESMRLGTDQSNLLPRETN